MLSGRSTLDVRMAKISKNPERLRLTESIPFIEALKQKTATSLIYGNASVSPKEFTGFAPRMSLKSAGNGGNIIDAGGANSVNSSVFICVWGETTGYGIYPEGTQGGLIHTPLDPQDALDADNNPFRAFVDLFEWNQGLAILDWEYFVRVANIDITKLVTETGAADLTKALLKGIMRIPSLDAGTAVIYMNRTVLQMLTIQRQAVITAGGGITWENIDGKIVYKFMGITIRIMDQILNTETRVV